MSAQGIAMVLPGVASLINALHNISGDNDSSYSSGGVRGGTGGGSCGSIARATGTCGSGSRGRTTSGYAYDDNIYDVNGNIVGNQFATPEPVQPYSMDETTLPTGTTAPSADSLVPASMSTPQTDAVNELRNAMSQNPETGGNYIRGMDTSQLPEEYQGFVSMFRPKAVEYGYNQVVPGMNPTQDVEPIIENRMVAPDVSYEDAYKQAQQTLGTLGTNQVLNQPVTQPQNSNNRGALSQYNPALMRQIQGQVATPASNAAGTTSQAQPATQGVSTTGGIAQYSPTQIPQQTQSSSYGPTLLPGGMSYGTKAVGSGRLKRTVQTTKEFIPTANNIGKRVNDLTQLARQKGMNVQQFEQAIRAQAVADIQGPLSSKGAQTMLQAYAWGVRNNNIGIKSYAQEALRASGYQVDYDNNSGKIAFKAPDIEQTSQPKKLTKAEVARQQEQQLTSYGQFVPQTKDSFTPGAIRQRVGILSRQATGMKQAGVADLGNQTNYINAIRQQAAKDVKGPISTAERNSLLQAYAYGKQNNDLGMAVYASEVLKRTGNSPEYNASKNQVQFKTRGTPVNLTAQEEKATKKAETQTRTKGKSQQSQSKGNKNVDAYGRDTRAKALSLTKDEMKKAYQLGFSTESVMYEPNLVRRQLSRNDLYTDGKLTSLGKRIVNSANNRNAGNIPGEKATKSVLPGTTKSKGISKSNQVAVSSIAKEVASSVSDEKQARTVLEKILGNKGASDADIQRALSIWRKARKGTK